MQIRPWCFKYFQKKWMHRYTWHVELLSVWSMARIGQFQTLKSSQLALCNSRSVSFTNIRFRSCVVKCEFESQFELSAFKNTFFGPSILITNARQLRGIIIQHHFTSFTLIAAGILDDTFHHLFSSLSKLKSIRPMRRRYRRIHTRTTSYRN